MQEKDPSVSKPWIGQDGRTYRTISYWVGVGWTSTFLQVEDDLGNWYNI
jgi:hypothetical protein